MRKSQFVSSLEDAVVIAATTLGRKDLGKHIHNTGATGSVTVTLHSGEIGDRYQISVNAAQALVITGSTGAIFVLAGTAGTANQSLRNSGTAGESCEIVCISANKWLVRSLVGTHFSVS